MNPGDKVSHPRLGKGEVIQVIPRGGRLGVFVDFGFLTDWFACDALQVSDSADPSGDDGEHDIVDRRRPRVADIGEETVDARRAVLALKLGQVPENAVLELSAGTDEECNRLAQAIDSVTNRSPVSILVKGAWGTGKTHLLTMMTALAANSGLATASVILDQEGVTLSDPMRLMADILNSLRFPNEAVPAAIMSRIASLQTQYQGINGMFRATQERLAMGDPRRPNDFEFLTNRVIKAVFRIRQGAFDEPEVTEVLADYFMLRLPASGANRKLGYRYVDTPLDPLTARRTVDRADRFCDLLRGWVQVCLFAEEGAKGLVVIIDELDVDYDRTSRNTNQNIELRRRRRMVLKALGRLQRESIPLLLAFGVAPAIVPVEENDAVSDLRQLINGIIEIEAPEPDSRQTGQIGGRLLELYERAYTDRMAEVDRAMLKQLMDKFAERHHSDITPIPRTFVRGTLEMLDVASDL